MGNQLTTDTLCSRDDQGNSYWVGVDWKSFCKGNRKKCYRGCLNGLGPRSGEKVVVKASKNKTGSRASWQSEKLRAQTANLLLQMFESQCDLDEKITINIPLIALMDSVSKMNELFGSRSRSSSLNSDEWVGIESYIPGKFSIFCVTRHCEEEARGNLLEAFSHFTYHQSRGAFVVCEFQGVHYKDSYHITSPTVHSQNGEFGSTDLGPHGLNEFFKMHRCNDICRKWSRMQPLSPPPSFEDIFQELTRPCPSAPPLEEFD